MIRAGISAFSFLIIKLTNSQMLTMQCHIVELYLIFLLCEFVNCRRNLNVLTLADKLHDSDYNLHLSYVDDKLISLKNFTRKYYTDKYERQNESSVLTEDQKKCLKDVLYILKSIKSEWAIKMLDSFGKLPSGVLLGNLLWIGKYSECIKVNVSKSENGTSGFYGMYCMTQWNISLPNKIHVPMSEVPVKTGICLPHSCYKIDVKSDISHIIDLLYALPVIKHYDGDLKLTSVTCRNGHSHLDFSTLVFLIFLCLYMLLPIAGSFLTIATYLGKLSKNVTASEKNVLAVEGEMENLSDVKAFFECKKEEDEDVEADRMENNNLIETTKNEHCKNSTKKIIQFLKCFCLFTNAAQILNTESTRKQFPCLHGIRFFSMTWVILGHTYIHNINYIDNYIDLLKGIDNAPFQAIIQGTFSVDTFFLIGGFLLGYLYLKEADKRNGRINWLGLCIHRVLRITPVYLFLIGFATLVFKFLGSGPFWEDAADVATCKQYWWWNLLYINNFLPINSMCLTWTWYLANDMQFFIISSLLLYIVWRWRYIGIGIFCSILICSWAITFCLSSRFGISPLFMGITNVKNYTEYQGNLILAWDILYSKPYCRIGPHIIGLLLGCFMYYNNSKKFLFKKIVQMLGWSIAAACSASVVYGLYHTNADSNVLNLYNAFGRSVFSIGIAWLIFCCLTENSGFINDFLSYKAWIPLSRLTYCAYLFHPIVMNWYFQTQETPLFFTHTTMVVLFFSFLLISYGVAFIISITFEAPLINLEKLIYKRS